jgi:hypothetical protein
VVSCCERGALSDECWGLLHREITGKGHTLSESRRGFPPVTGCDPELLSI